MLSQGAGFWQLLGGLAILTYGLLVKFLISDPFNTVPSEGALSFVPILLGTVLAGLGLLRCLGK